MRRGKTGGRGGLLDISAMVLRTVIVAAWRQRRRGQDDISIRSSCIIHKLCARTYDMVW